ncbi:MAG: ABC-F family ATP-binding cassette domain-containing protein [Kiritimatiellaeota bacterium]|nr:ABC-F family ATP-binding cassette domain-containing protein [Kiritimatiellota bacterium]
MIDFKNVCKSYLGKDVLLDATFRVGKGERVGVVGPNGAGKTTIFGLITGDVDPDKGGVSFPDSATIGYLRQQLPDGESSRTLLDFTADALPELAELHSEIERLEHDLVGASGTENSGKLTILGELQSKFEMAGGYEMTTRAKTILSGLGFPEEKFETPLSAFSGGWRMRAALSRVLVADPYIMLLDEPSNYLDTPAVEWLARFLNSFKGTLLLISHDRFLLKHLTNITIEVNNGLVSRFAGNYDFYEREREQRFASLQAAKRNQDLQRRKMENFVERFRAKSTKAAQAKNKLKQIEKMEEIIVPDSLSYSGAIRIPAPPRAGAEIARLENVAFSYNGGENVLEDIELKIDRGAKIALVGYNGTGKTTLLKLLAGVILPTAGKRVLGHHVVVGYQAQEFGETLPPEQSLFDVVRAAAPGTAELKRVRGVLGSFGFSGDDVDKPCGVLSGGEKIRLSFARIFINPPNFLLLDEPTTHLDIAAREGLQMALKEYSGTLCLVSHDIEFLRAAADVIMEMTPPGVKRYFGNYDYFQEKRAETEPNPRKIKTESAAAAGGNSKIDKKALRREKALLREKVGKTKKEIESRMTKAERRLETLENEKLAITAKIEANEPDLDFFAVNKRLIEIEEDVRQLTERWEEAAEKLEKL